MSGSFQKSVNAWQAPGLPGDFASANPRAVALTSQWQDSTGATHVGFTAGANGLTIGLFAWLDTATHSIASNSGIGAAAGFVHRAAEALITTYLTAYGMTIPAGFEVGNVFAAGDFFVVNNGLTEATPGMKAYANNLTGVASFALTGNPSIGATATSASIAMETLTAIGAITDDILNATTIVTGTLYPGAILAGPSSIASGTQIISQLTGTTGAAGTYLVAPRAQTVANGSTITGSYGLMTVTGTVSGTLGVNLSLTGTSVSSGSAITGLGTGTGAAGTYIVNNSQSIASEGITAWANTETGWYCRSFAQPGEVAKIATTSQG